MRRGTMGMHIRMLLGSVALALGGCPGQELAPLTPCTVSAVTERVDQAGVSEVDLLFMIDNSASMAPKQLKLARELPRLLSVLTSGDRCAGLAECPYSDTTPTKRRFTAVKSLHLGVVTSNLGGIDDLPSDSQQSLLSCLDNGDDARLQNSVTVAVNGVTAGKNEFPAPIKEGEKLILADLDCELGDVDRYLSYVANESDLDATLKQFSCVSKVGPRGCPFEQQLEAAWKALAPSSKTGPDYEFLNGTHGQGDDYNDGFLRDDAVLAVVLVTDEDDCAITEEGKPLFLPGNAPGGADALRTYGGLNVRCGLNVGDGTLIRPTERYKRAFASLKPDNPDRVIFGAITGVPMEAFARGDSVDEILALPAMQFQVDQVVDPANSRPLTSCTNATGVEVAYPPIRIAEVVRDFGKQGFLYSICEDDYGPALNILIGKIASQLKGNCLPRQLNPDLDGKVGCEVYELLPENNRKCDAMYGHRTSGPNGGIVKRTVREKGEGPKEREACLMEQVAVESVDGKKTPADTLGWYYDDFDPILDEDCPPDQHQRIAFRFADGSSELRGGAGATFECFQPVARIDNDAKGFDAINTRCGIDDGNDVDECATRSNGDEGGYDLFCRANTCQVGCESNPECPPGWVCGAAEGDESELKFCQLPTCPPDDSQSSRGSTDAS
jgi:hypothetical protein